MADEGEDEKAPLLSVQDESHSIQNQITGTTLVQPLAPDELPPPYNPSEGGVPMVDCRVCQKLIDIEGKLHQHVVKCPVCNEATPIKPAPQGKKYVRCPCNCLLICKATSQRIACPRPNCKRVINLVPQNDSIPMAHNIVPGSCRVICGHCQEVFLFNTLNNALARCPHCRKVSSVGPSFARNRAMIFGIVGFLFLCAGIGVTVGTYSLSGKGFYFVWIGAFVIGSILMCRCFYFVCMKVSHIQGPA